MAQNYVTDASVVLESNDFYISLQGKIIEHSPHVHAGKAGMGFQGQGQHSSPGYRHLAQSVRHPAPTYDFVEFRFPHKKKKKFAEEFLGSQFPKTVGVGGGNLYLTYGKMNTYQKRLLSPKEALLLTKNGLDSGMTLGGGIGAVVVASGLTVATAGITLGAGLAVAAVAVAGAAIAQHRANLANKQVFLRVSRSPFSTVAKNYFPYEDKVYRTAASVGSITYEKIAQMINLGS